MTEWGDHFLGVVYGKPQALQRHRCLKSGRTYLPAPSRKEMTRIAAYVSDKMADHDTVMIPRGIPITAHIIFVHKKPARAPASMAAFWTQKKWRDNNDRIAKMTKPDVDNLAKLVIDACTQAGLWHDDGQVVQLNVYDFYASIHEEEKTIFRISVEAKYMTKSRRKK